jgi:hypothetical protein
MRDQAKKVEDDFLVVHKPPLVAGKEIHPAAENLPADVNRLAARLRAATGADERSRLLAAIQNRFGNGFAARVADLVRNVPSAPSDGESSGGEHR